VDKKTNLIWIDLEMTGLDETKERIIEIATLVTDSDLNEIGIGPELVIHQSDTLLEQMSEWCVRQHTGSGLVARVRDSQVTEHEAEQQTLAFLAQFVEAKASPMCGNTICTDRRFLARYMPALEAFFHYRHIDVSTIKELARRWRPELFGQVKKSEDHRALSDIRASINELRWYREQWLS
jgi:oligoribonuclease